MVESKTDTVRAHNTIAPLFATAIVGAGSVATLGLSVVAMKAYALLIGPEGVGVLALLQSLLNLGFLVAGFGLGTSTIGLIASVRGRGGSGLAVAVGRQAVAVGLACGLAGAGLFVVLRIPLAEIALGSAARGADIPWLATALVFSVTASVQVGVLSGLNRVAAVTAVNIGTALGATGFGVLIVVMFGEAGLAPTLLVAAAAQLGVATIALARVGRRIGPQCGASLMSVARDLFNLGTPIVAGQLVTGGVALVVPLVILQLLGTADVGYYRAAAAISIGIGTLFAASLTYDYYPRAAASRDSALAALNIERRMRMVVGMGAPLILGFLAIGPALIEVLYSSDFAPAFSVLQWQLVGDLLRLPALVLVFALLARSAGSGYLIVELTAALTLGAGTLVGLSVLGLEGAGVGYAAAQLVTYCIAWIVVGRRLPTAPGRLQAGVLAVAVICAAILSFDITGWVRTAIFAASAIVLAGTAWPRLYRLHVRDEL